MWSQPTDLSRGVVYSSHSIDHKRLRAITAELTKRVNASTSQVSFRPPDRQPRSGTKPQRILARNVPPITLSTELSQSLSPKHEQLELKVLKILKRYGKPTHQGKELAAAIVRESLAQDYDPMFVAAVIKSESAFNSHARSHKGAQGLMQIMPRTGAWLASKASLPQKKLTDTQHNLRLGISYLKQLESEYGGDRVLALMAYNWGPGRIASASNGGRKVPGPVVQYAVKILNDYRRWSTEVG